MDASSRPDVRGTAMVTAIACRVVREKMSTRVLTAVIHQEDDLFVAQCPEVGTVSQGHTIQEAVRNLKEATELYLEEFPLPETGRPLITTFEASVA